MLQRYETLILSIPEITNDESKAIEAAIEKTVKSTKGSVISYDRWGKYRLAYPIQKKMITVFTTLFDMNFQKIQKLVSLIVSSLCLPSSMLIQ